MHLNLVYSRWYFVSSYPILAQIPVSESLAVEGSHGVCYALGDNAVCPAHVPASAQVAFQQSE